MVMEFVMGPWDGLTVADEKAIAKRFSNVKFCEATLLEDDTVTNVVRITYAVFSDDSPGSCEYLTCWYLQQPGNPECWLHMQYSEDDDEEAGSTPQEEHE